MSEILLTPQMTGTKHEDSTTLRVQPCSCSSRIHHVRAHGESSLCCGELLSSPRGDDFESDGDQNNPAQFFLKPKSKQRVGDDAP